MLHTVCKTTDIPAGDAREFTVAGTKIAVYNCEGRFFASQWDCSHAHVPLSQGYIDGSTCVVECPEHGSKFELATGAVKGLPATQPINIYPVKIKGDDVLVDIG